jgi:hypothetical protein
MVKFAVLKRVENVVLYGCRSESRYHLNVVTVKFLSVYDLNDCGYHVAPHVAQLVMMIQVQEPPFSAQVGGHDRYPVRSNNKQDNSFSHP